MSSLAQLRRIAEVEFAAIVVQTDMLGAKLRVLLTDTSYVDVWVSRTLSGRFGFHWERRHLDGRIYRYDNFPDTNWSSVATFPAHFHVAIRTPWSLLPLPQRLSRASGSLWSSCRRK